MIVKQCKEFYWSGNKEDDGNVDSVENDEEVGVARDTERGKGVCGKQGKVQWEQDYGEMVNSFILNRQIILCTFNELSIKAFFLQEQVIQKNLSKTGTVLFMTVLV